MSGTLPVNKIFELLDQEFLSKTVNQRRKIFYDDFDQAAIFLLQWEMSNLFEPAAGASFDGWLWRCKGCTKVIARNGRANHHRAHKREYAAINELVT